MIKNSRGYFTFFIILTTAASLNDYWKILKLDVLFAPDKKKDNSKGETNDLPDSDGNLNENEVPPNGKINVWIIYVPPKINNFYFKELLNY